MDVAEYAEVTSHYVRARECLLLRVNMEAIFVDHYLHWGALSEQMEASEDTVLKDMMAVTLLHACSRPRSERHAWTLNVPMWSQNYYVAASNPEEEIVGCIHREGVDDQGELRLVSQVQEGRGPIRSSVVGLEGLDKEDALRLAQAFYDRSEQRPARFVRGKGDRYWMLAAMPGSDGDWVRDISDEEIFAFDDTEELSFMERRKMKFHCRCSLERIFPAVEAMLRADFEGLFAGDESMLVSCPRCKESYKLTREMAEAYLSENDNKSS